MGISTSLGFERPTKMAAFKANLKVRLIERLNNAYYVLNIRNPADYFFPGGRYGVYTVFLLSLCEKIHLFLMSLGTWTSIFGW